ncbi:50S ribosomal protein L4 [Candidatus Vidania fulgoroideorum]
MLITLHKQIKLKPQYIKPNTQIQIDKCLQANCMTGTKSKKTRGTKRYSTKKLTPQKGSGKARKGSRSSPLLVGGGKAFIDIKNHAKKKINKKTYLKYLKFCIYKKYSEKKIKLIKDSNTYKTTHMAYQLCGNNNNTINTLIVCSHTTLLAKITKNIPSIQHAYINTINPILINRSNLIMISQECYIAFFKKKFSNEITIT